MSRCMGWVGSLTNSLMGGCLIGGLLTAAELQGAPQPRVPWTTSRVVGSPEPPLPYRTQPMYTQFQIEQPVYAAREPETNHLFVVKLQKGKEPGEIHRLVDAPDVSTSQRLLSMDRLIYGLCFHPRYAENRYIYTYANGPIDAKPKFNRISRFTVPLDETQQIDPASELVILEWESNGHNGGEPAFGPDGMLYAATGDGTSDSDPLLTGQGVDDLLAVMLRIDVDHPDPDRNYSIPRDNPFLDHPGARGEIWAFGFRNPWRTTFDRKTGQLWVTQNGQDLWEQVYLVKRGENYGWSVQEGGHPFYLNRPVGPGPIVPPAADHHHTEARSLTGGVVYYGSRLPELNGAYIYGDYSTGRIWGIRHDNEKVTWHQELVDTPFAIVGFVETHGGELAVIDQHTGFHRLEVAPPQPDRPPFPTKLSDTGLFTSTAEHELHPGVIPYSVNSPLWSDGAHKDRYFALPGWSQVEFTPTRPWVFPDGTVLVKTFSLERDASRPESLQRIETRLLLKEQGEWLGYSYAWNDDQTDAVLVEKNGRDQEFAIQDVTAAEGVRRQTWHFPSRTECMVCHSRAAGFVLGLQTPQMNRVHEYADGPAHQFDRLSQLGVLEVKPGEHPGLANQWKTLMTQLEKPFLTQPQATVSPIAKFAKTFGLADYWQKLKESPKTIAWIGKSPSEYTTFADPYDDAQPLEARVRSYLHVNCSVCHQDAGGGNSQFNLSHHLELSKTLIVDVDPLHDRLAIDNAKLIAPGAPERSLMLQRLQRRGRGQMPPLATSLVDPRGTALLAEWIRALPQEAPQSPAPRPE